MAARDRNEKGRAENPERRSLLTKLWIGLGIVGVVEFVALAATFLRPRRRRPAEGDYGSVIVAGRVEDFEPGSVTAFPRGRFYLARLADGGFLALSRKCTHLGCTVPWNAEEKRFVCPCHASVFDIRGEVIRPPAPRALDLFPVTIENRVVKVDTGKRIVRSQFRPAQAAYPREKG